VPVLICVPAGMDALRALRDRALPAEGHERSRSRTL